LRGQRFVLYFYPKDDTAGCTIEACNFRDSLTSFNALNVPVFGISPDNVKSHAKFRVKYGLTFPLLADAEHQVAEAFGTWVEKSMYGRKYMGIQRSTFIIGPAGTIERVWEKVTPAEHTRDVLAYLNTAPTTSACVATKPAVEPAAQAAAIEKIVKAQTEVTEVEYGTVNETVPGNAPKTAAEASMKPARKKSPVKAQAAPEPVDIIVVDSVLESPGELPVEIVEVFAVSSAPSPVAVPPAAKKPTAKKPAAKKPAAAVKKPAAKKVAAAAKKPAAKKPTASAKKSAAKKPVAAARKPAAKKPTASAKKSAAKKPTASAKKSAAKKPTASAKR
jgi:peroxiredoxin Q/BCP